jgi:hypothetical protein
VHAAFVNGERAIKESSADNRGTKSRPLLPRASAAIMAAEQVPPLDAKHEAWAPQATLSLRAKSSSPRQRQ